MAFGLTTLQDLGELRLIDEIVLPLAREHDLSTEVGDDCSYVETRGALVAVTADVGPKPLLQSLPGYENDYEAAGWLAVVATASDVATAGARPLFLTNCIDAPPEFLVDDFISYLRGYFRACAAFGFRNGGGDVRHGPQLAIRVFGAGVCDKPYKIGRGNIDEGDILAVVGPAGCFMANYLIAKGDAVLQNGSLVKLRPSAESILRYPRPQLREMHLLAKHDLVVAATDTSDGLLGAIDNLSRKSRCGFELHLTGELLSRDVKEAANSSGVDHWNIFFAWGDWSVAVAIRPSNYERFRKLCSDENIRWSLLGAATTRHREIFGRLNKNDRKKILPIRNENFVQRGFNAGLDGHLRYILETRLFGQER